MSASSYQGSCLCGDIKFSVEGEPQKVFNCYCSDCTKNAGAPYQLIAKYDSSKLSVEDPKNLQTVFTIKKTISGHEKKKVFCRQCGCTLWTIPMHHKGALTIMRTSLIDGGIERWKPEMEMFGQLRPRWFKET